MPDVTIQLNPKENKQFPALFMRVADGIIAAMNLPGSQRITCTLTDRDGASSVNIHSDSQRAIGAFQQYLRAELTLLYRPWSWAYKLDHVDETIKDEWKAIAGGYLTIERGLAQGKDFDIRPNAILFMRRSHHYAFLRALGNGQIRLPVHRPSPDPAQGRVVSLDAFRKAAPKR